MFVGQVCDFEVGVWVVVLWVVLDVAERQVQGAQGEGESVHEGLSVGLH